MGAVPGNAAGGEISGTVTDQSGAVVAGAAVAVTDERTNNSRTTETDANGRYRVTGLETGDYDVKASAPGFRNSEVRETVSDPKPLVANFKLLVGAVSESVTVEDSSAQIETGSGQGLKKMRNVVAKPMAAPLFEMETDKGVHWVSVDGLNWQRK